MIDYEIPNYTLPSINLDKNIGRGMAVYSHVSIDKSIYSEAYIEANKINDLRYKQ